MKRSVPGWTGIKSKKRRLISRSRQSLLLQEALVRVGSVVLKGSGIKLTLILRLGTHSIGLQIIVYYHRSKSSIFEGLNQLKKGFKLT